MERICSAANWSSPNAFVKFHCLDVTGQGFTEAVPFSDSVIAGALSPLLV